MPSTSIKKCSGILGYQSSCRLAENRSVGGSIPPLGTTQHHPRFCRGCKFLPDSGNRHHAGIGMEIGFMPRGELLASKAFA
jgi:hypothetical protein